MPLWKLLIKYILVSIFVYFTLHFYISSRLTEDEYKLILIIIILVNLAVDFLNNNIFIEFFDNNQIQTNTNIKEQEQEYIPKPTSTLPEVPQYKLTNKFYEPLGAGLEKFADQKYVLLNTDKWAQPVSYPPNCINNDVKPIDNIMTYHELI